MTALTPTQHQILRVLASSVKPLPVEEVSTALGLHANTVREALSTLIDNAMVKRERSETSGPGRPHWLYQATVSMDPQAVLQEFANFSAAVAEQIAEESPDPKATAVQLGRLWGKQILDSPDIPDHSAIDAHHAVTHDLAIHSAKIRVFLSRLGFEASPGEDITTIELHQCPLQADPDSPRRLICSIHQGMSDEVVGTLSRGRLSTKVAPFAGPGYCQVALRTRRADNHPLSSRR